MAYDEKRQGDLCIFLSCSTHKVLDHAVILILSSTVVCMQEDFFLTEAVLLEKEVELANHCVRSLPTERVANWDVVGIGWNLSVVVGV